MGKLTGSVLILAGVAVAAYTLASSPQRDAAPQLATAQDVGVSETAAQAALPAPGTAPLPSEARAAEAPPQAPPPESEATAAPNPPTASPVPPLVVGPERLAAALQPVPVNEAPPRQPVGDPSAGPPLNRPTLVREIQRHLKRIGCYRGDLSGVWTPAVREAMQAFTDRVNASLPTEQPDPILLAMVQSHAPGTCSATCPAGQTRAGSGRCVPNALVASADKERAAKSQMPPDPRKGARAAASAPAASAAPATAGMAELEPSAEGRMSLAGPAAAEPRRARANAARVAPARATTVKRATSSYWSANVRARTRYRTTQRPAETGFSSWLFPF